MSCTTILEKQQTFKQPYLRMTVKELSKLVPSVQLSRHTKFEIGLQNSTAYL